MALGRWMRRGGLGIAAVLAVWGVLWLVAYTMTDRSGWARAITWMDSDVDDQHRFPARPIANAPPRFDFKQPDMAERERLAPVWRAIEVDSGGHKQVRPFEDFMRETDTLAFLVLRDDVLLYEGCRDTGTDPAERYQYL